VRRVSVLVNPASGKGRGTRSGLAAVRRLRDLGWAVNVVVGRDGAEADELGRRALAQHPDAFVAVGGDGTVHAALQLLQQAGGLTPLGLLPAGTGNDIARALGLSGLGPEAAADVVDGGIARWIDLGHAAGRWFGGVLSSGFDSRVNQRANRMRWPHGAALYNLAILAELGVFRPVPFRIEVDGAVVEAEAMLVAVGNGPSYGGGMRVCPDARIDDGLLSVTVLHAISTATFLRLFPRVYRGTHVSHPAVSVHHGRVVKLEALDVLAYADGEPAGPLPLTVECRPGAQAILVPGA
jgi:diacylglycerol kinase (ATP)